MTCDCPNCGASLDNLEVCPNCGFDFNDTLSCPYKMSNRCLFNKRICLVHGLDFEDCTIYLHKSGIISK